MTRLLTSRVLMAIALAALLVHASPLAPLWYDEIYTLGVFVAQGPAGFLTDYHLPNNHVLYTLLLWGWRAVVGDDPLRLRVLGLLLTMCALPALFIAGRAIAGARAGALAALVLGSSQVAGNFAAQLRGYGLSIALIAVCLAGAALWCKSGLRDRRALAVYGLSGALAVWAVPTNLVFVGAVGLWVVICARTWRRRACMRRSALLALPLLGLLGYVGMWRKILELLAAPKWQSWSDFITVIAHDVLFGDLPWLLPGLLLVVFLDRHRLAKLAPLWALFAVTTLALLLPLLGPVPWPRNYVPLLPLLALAGGMVLDRLAAHAPGGHASVLSTLVLVMLARPLLRPATDPYAASTLVARPGDLLAPYYLDEQFAPHLALATLLAERDPPPSLLLMGGTIYLELEPYLLALRGRHLICQLRVGREGAAPQTLCLPTREAETQIHRLVVIANHRDDAERLRQALSVDFASGTPLAPMQQGQRYHRLWATPVR